MVGRPTITAAHIAIHDGGERAVYLLGMVDGRPHHVSLTVGEGEIRNGVVGPRGVVVHAHLSVVGCDLRRSWTGRQLPDQPSPVRAPRPAGPHRGVAR